MSPNATPTLFYLPGADAGSTQWRLASLQIVNWGGFHGYTEIEFAPGTTLLSGASGSGKSTLLDAYIAVTMDSGTPFNGASNDATLGRARSANQRNLVSYLRGKLDTGRDSDTRELTDQVLRGQGCWTWGALALAFIDDNGHRYTIARLYYVPAAATRDSDLTRKMCTVEGSIDLRELEPLAEGRFDKRAVTGRFPQLKMHDTYTAFSQAFFTRLGIGAHGDGAKAMRLLARIQAGHQVHTVDELYKTMVLELPGTFAAADAALNHFKDLEDSYEAMITEERKAQVLGEIPTGYAQFETALERARLIDTFGIYREGADTPFGLWALNTEDGLLARAETANRSAESTARQRRTTAETDRTGLESRKADVERDLSKNDAHATVLRLEAQAAQARQDAEAARGRRDAFDRGTARLCLELTSEKDFTDAQNRSREFLTGYDEAHRKLARDRDALLRSSFEPQHEKTALTDERTSLADRDGRMDPGLHESRMAIARATGIDPQDLPFLGELIDVLPEHKRWTKAIETTLHGPARVLLIDARRLDEVSKKIDPLRLPKRVNFQGVDLTPEPTTVDAGADPRYVSGKLAYKPTRFTAWVHERITAEHTDALCVESPEELGRGGYRVTVNGQTRHGRAGAHGELKTPPVIGFSREERLAEIAQRLDELETVLDGIDREVKDVDAEINGLSQTKTAHEYVVRTESWRGIDPDGIEKSVKDLDSQREAILASDDTLRDLRAELERVAGALDEVIGQIAIATNRINGLDGDYDAICERKDEVVGEIQRIERAQSVVLTEEQAAFLSGEFSGDLETGDRAAFQKALSRLRRDLGESGRVAREKADAERKLLEATFQRYLDTWPSPNLSASIENYPSFRMILDTILATGLHERREEWSRRLTNWSGQDLVPLAGAFSMAFEEIEERLEPVNEILGKLPFGARRGRLKIDLHELQRDDIVKFKRELAALSRANTDGYSADEVQAWFTRLRRFMRDIRKDAERNRRDYFLDVRQHIEITAVSFDDQGREIATYATLGGKSGGESQELVAFIVGAALRFQLGDEANVRPSFAPVLIDEGFVKADGEFTGRSVDAWKGLGFQLVIGAPYDKFTSLEPHADLILHMEKSGKGHSFVSSLVPAEARPGSGLDDDGAAW